MLTIKIARPEPMRIRVAGSGASFAPAVTEFGLIWSEAEQAAEAAHYLIGEAEQEVEIWTKNAVRLQVASPELFENAHAAHIARLNDYVLRLARQTERGYAVLAKLAELHPLQFVREQVVADTLGRLDGAARWLFQLRTMAAENEALAREVKKRRSALSLALETMKRAPELIAQAGEAALRAMIERLQRLLTETTGLGIGGVLFATALALAGVWALSR